VGERTGLLGGERLDHVGDDSPPGVGGGVAGCADDAGVGHEQEHEVLVREVRARRLASTYGFGADQHPAATAIMASPESATLDKLAADVASGAVRVPITHTYQLEETPQALADFGAGTLGKLAVAV
jgi:NADPH:quinone reductase-like Zn-dependent oxidoreductase